MKAVIQRVLNASVTINHQETRSINRGIVILLGVQDTDTPAICQKLAVKCAGLRIFDDENGDLNVSAEENGYEAMVVSNFTLYGDTKKGRRPSFLAAAKPPLSVDCYEAFIAHLKNTALAHVVTGEFGADMQIALVNDGPITIVIETDDWKK
ncbi:MAG: D-aminoacyl-tRNA deacylase [Ruthenibacterium sp.]